MRLREGLLALLLALATALIVYSIAVSQQQQQAATASRQLLQQVYVRALREYYQWLSAIREQGPDALMPEHSTLLSPYLSRPPLATADWQLRLNLQDLSPVLQVPDRHDQVPWLAFQFSSPEWPAPVAVRLDLLSWLEQITVDLGYGVLPVEVHYLQHRFQRPESRIQAAEAFNDFLLPELTLVLDAASLQARFRQQGSPLLNAVLIAALVLVIVLLGLQQWYQRQRIAQMLADTEASLQEQQRSNERQRAALQDNGKALHGLNLRLQNAWQQLELSERLAGLGELSAGIAHEINNPIAYVRSNLQELNADVQALTVFIRTLDEASDGMDIHSPMYQKLLAAYQQLQISDVLQDAPVRLNDCLEGIERAARIVSDMRKLSHGGQGMQWCQVNDDIRSVVNIARSRLGTGVTLDAELETLPDVYCNPSQIAQVVMNILVNAIQALSGRGGHITLRETLLNQELRIVIADNGPGMDEKTAARVFEPFFTTKPGDEGTGLGLALCHKLMKAHAGRIELHTSPGKGAEFTIVFPVNGGMDHAE